jgi:endonuclease III
MKIKTTFIVLTLLNLVTACAQMDSHPMNMTQLVQDARTSADHETLAKHYEDTAKEMQTNADEHKKLLVQYQAGNYGKQAQNLKMHCEFLIRAYQQAAEENMRMASAHRQMAVDAEARRPYE